MTKNISRYTSAMLAAAALTSAAFAVDATEATGGNLNKRDLKFITEAGQGGMLEVSVGQLAQERGGTPAVKDIGNMLATDHAKAAAELKEIAKSKGVLAPQVLDPKHSDVVVELGKKQGEAFDKAFLADLEKDHKEDIALFQEAAKEVTDPDLKSYVEKTIPVLQKHLEHIQSARGK